MQDFTCYKDAELLRVQVVTESAERKLFCEVILWLSPEEPLPLSGAESVVESCAERIQMSIVQLTDDQWLCRPTNITESMTKL